MKGKLKKDFSIIIGIVAIVVMICLFALMICFVGMDTIKFHLSDSFDEMEVEAYIFDVDANRPVSAGRYNSYRNYVEFKICDADIAHEIGSDMQSNSNEIYELCKDKVGSRVILKCTFGRDKNNEIIYDDIILYKVFDEEVGDFVEVEYNHY